MDAIEAMRIARLALAMHFDIEPDVVAGKYVGAYVAIGSKKCDIDAAEAYNKLAEMQAHIGEPFGEDGPVEDGFSSCTPFNGGHNFCNPYREKLDWVKRCNKCGAKEPA